MELGALREGIAAAHLAPPPLRKMQHRRIVQRHLMIQTPDLPARCAQAHAEFRLFSCDQIIAIAADCFERITAHHDVATASLYLASGIFHS